MVGLSLGSSIRTALTEVFCVADTRAVDVASSEARPLVTGAEKERVFASGEVCTSESFAVGAWASNAWVTSTCFSGRA